MTQMDELFMPLTLSLIKSTANLVLRVTHDGPPETASQIGEHWVTQFKKWHPEFYEHTSRPLKIDRNVAQDENALKLWFEVFNQTMMENEILPSDLWNFDETGFNIGMAGNTVILTKHLFW